MTDIDRTTDVGLYNTAVSFLNAARALEKAGVKSTHPIFPIVFLYSHAVELFLKSFLKLQGVTAAEMKKKIGHDIDALAKRCVTAGLSLDDEDSTVIGLIASGNTLISTRYIATGAFRWPSSGGLYRTGTSLRNSVRSALKSAGHKVR